MSVTFSIIIVTKNAAATLERAIASVGAQRYRPHEFIIVDGASSDGTIGIIERHRHLITHFCSEPDRGIYDAMNKGLARATGDFIYFLGADDYLFDDRVLGDVAAFLGPDPGADLVYGGLQVRFPDGSAKDFMPPAPEGALAFMISGCLPHQASFASRRAFAIAGNFDLRYRIAGDYEWFLRILTQPALAIRRFERIVACYRMDGMSNRLAESQAEVYAIQNRLPLFQQQDWRRRRLRVFRRELFSQRRRSVMLASGPSRRHRLAKAMALGELLLRDVLGRVVALGTGGFSSEGRLRALQQDLLAQRIANDAREWRSPDIA